MEAFAKAFKPQHQLLIGGQGIPLEEFFLLSSAMLGLDHVLFYIGIQSNYTQITITHCVGSIISICAFN